MTTVVKDIGKCTVCNKHKEPAEFENPLAKRFGICDQCFMHRQRDWEDADLDERENLKEKAVMAVSSPEEGETCNCNHGDHSNANGDLHSMYNQEGGRANWQGQGLPQPKHSNCQCDEQPVEHDKVPNADARLGEPKKDKKKGKTSPSERNRFSRRLATTSGRKKDKLIKPSKGKKETKEILANPSDAVRLNYERNIAAGLAGGKERKKRPDRAAQRQAIADIMYKKIFGDKKDKKRTDITQSILTIKSGLEDILKKRKVRGVKGNKRSRTHFSGKWRGTLGAQEGSKDIISNQDNAATAANREVAAKLGFIKPTSDKIIGTPKHPNKPKKPKAGKKINTTGAGTKEQAESSATNTKEQKEGRTGKRETKSFSFQAILEDIIKKNKKITSGEKEKKKLEANLSADVIANMKRVDDLKNHIDELGRDSRTQHATEGLQLITPQRKKLQRELIAAKEKPKKRVKKPSKFQILDFVRHCNNIIAKVTGEAEANPEWSAQEWLDNYKKKKKKVRTIKGIINNQQQIPDQTDKILAGLKRKKKKKKKQTEAEKAKEERALYIAGGAREADIARRDVTQAENNQFGAWGQRGLGDGSGTGAIQGSGETHLITPVTQKKLNELMRGIRYMPRSVSRKKKP